MKAAPFRYHAPRSLGEALALLAGSANARVLAGGQSLMPMLKMRVVAPDDLIDINEIQGLSYIRDESGEEGGEIAIGAMTRQRELEFSPMVAAFAASAHHPDRGRWAHLSSRQQPGRCRGGLA